MADGPTTTTKLRAMTAKELRAFARREGIEITYLTERKKEDLIKRIGEALKARSNGATSA